MGWIDHGDLWVFDVSGRSAHRVPLGSGAKYLVPYLGIEGRFSVVHQFDGSRFEVTVHAFSDPARALARATVTASGREFTGDALEWARVPRLYIADLTLPGFQDCSLFRIDHAHHAVDIERLGWYDERFDKGYQGILSVTEVPEDALAIFSIQRSSELVLHDLSSGSQRGVVRLSGRAGNPLLRFRTRAPELWVSDYDTIVKVERSTWRVKDACKLQGAAAGTRQFIGDFEFDSDETMCAVARPFSGDVVALDPATMKVRWRAEVGRQPLELATLRDRCVVARDWKTGDTLWGELKPRRFS
jgi:hypothetical protein